ncbi:MAG TPA: MarR family transcriptional regulator [Actinopolymorphaceae bacterium]
MEIGSVARRATESDGAEESEDTEALVSRIRAAELGMQLVAIRSRALGIFSADLTMQQVRVLLMLMALGDQSAHELAEALGVGATTLTGIVDRLEARALVRRVPDPEDRRVRRIGLAEQGRRMLAELQQVKHHHQRRVFARLDRADLRKLAEALEALEAAAREEFA